MAHDDDEMAHKNCQETEELRPCQTSQYCDPQELLGAKTVLRKNGDVRQDSWKNKRWSSTNMKGDIEH